MFYYLCFLANLCTLGALPLYYLLVLMYEYDLEYFWADALYMHLVGANLSFPGVVYNIGCD